MFVTVYVDASFCGTTKAYGWAAWVRSDEGRYLPSGNGVCVDSVEAELRAILYGIKEAVKQGGKKILLKSDCQAAVDMAKEGAPPSKRPKYKELQDDISRLCKSNNVIRDIRWVKGHQGEGSVPGWLNQRVHEMAYREMTKKRKELRPAYTPFAWEKDRPVKPLLMKVSLI